MLYKLSLPIFFPFFLKLELSCTGAQYSASAQKNPLLPWQAEFTVAQRLCIVAQIIIILMHMQQFRNPEKVIHLVHKKKQAHHLHGQQRGS